jgi:hypothetical protein
MFADLAELCRIANPNLDSRHPAEELPAVASTAAWEAAEATEAEATAALPVEEAARSLSPTFVPTRTLFPPYLHWVCDVDLTVC